MNDDEPRVVTGKLLLGIVGVILVFALWAWQYMSRALGL